MKIQYNLSIYDEQGSKEFLDWEDLDSLPRFQVGDQFDAYFFEQISDAGQRVVVTDARYAFRQESDRNLIRLSLRVRLETPLEEADRQRAFLAAHPFPSAAD